MNNFEDWKCRASAMGHLLTPPKDAKAKVNGELSATAKEFLIGAYVEAKYDRYEDFDSKYTTKGTDQEYLGVKLFSQFEKKEFKIHKKIKENEWFTGHIDIYEGVDIDHVKAVWDLKLPWSLNTFIANVMKPIDKKYGAQIQVYYDLFGCEEGGVVYALVSATEELISDELYRLRRKLNVIDDNSPEFQEAAAKVEYAMRFDDVPLNERILKFPIEKDPSFKATAIEKIKQARIFLQEIESSHLNFNTKHKYTSQI